MKQYKLHKVKCKHCDLVLERKVLHKDGALCFEGKQERRRKAARKYNKEVRGARPYAWEKSKK